MNYQQALLHYMLTTPVSQLHTTMTQHPSGDTTESLGVALDTLFKNKTLTRMWIDKDTQQVHAE